MPFVQTTTSSGSTNWFYTISTPSNPHATEIDPSLPTLLFLHAVYLNQAVFQRQWADTKIRRFNCVAFDIKEHGFTTNDDLPGVYGYKEATEDVAAFMNALKLPPCHVIGLSMGTIGALPLAMLNPELVKSLFLISPLALEEPADIAEGRVEILSCWKESLHDDPSAAQDAIYGALQLGFNNEPDSLANAAVALILPPGLKKWTLERFESYEKMHVKIFTERKRYTKEQLARIECPVQLVHCAQDIAYPVATNETFLADLKAAGVNAALEVVPDTPHFGNMTVDGAPVFNALIHDFVCANTDGEIPPARESVVSPWEEDLRTAGWTEDSDDE